MSDLPGAKDGGGGYPRARRRLPTGLADLTRGDVFTLGVAAGLPIAAVLRWFVA